MSCYELRYTPTSDLGRRFPSWVIATFRTREVAEAVVPTCPNWDSIEVVECGESSTLQGETGKIASTKRPLGGALTPSIPGALPTIKESTDA